MNEVLLLVMECFYMNIYFYSKTLVQTVKLWSNNNTGNVIAYLGGGSVLS